MNVCITSLSWNLRRKDNNALSKCLTQLNKFFVYKNTSFNTVLQWHIFSIISLEIMFYLGCFLYVKVFIFLFLNCHQILFCPIHATRWPETDVHCEPECPGHLFRSRTELFDSVHSRLYHRRTECLTFNVTS